MKLLALRPARAGSKRVVKKNQRKLGGLSLVERAIQISEDLEEIIDILVSTNDADIAEESKKTGAIVPWLRPESLATDMASTVDVCLHALDWYESNRRKVDGIVLLQPTSPFRKKNTLIHAINKYKTSRSDTIIGVSEMHPNPLWGFNIGEDEYMKPIGDKKSLEMRSQDIKPAYVVNGAYYLICPKKLRKYKSFYAGKLRPIICNGYEGLDIDTEEDWKYAEYLISMGFIDE